MTPSKNQTILNHYKNLKLFDKLYQQLNSNEKIIKVSRLHGSAKTLLLLDLIEKENQIILLTANQQQVNEFEVELRFLGLEEYLIVVDELSPQLLQERLTGLSGREKFILISTYQILETKLPAKEVLNENTTTLQSGTSLGYNDLIEYLNLINYQKEKFVESPGDYSQRGSIIDFWSYSEKMPARVEYDGDFIESIRYFDPESQRSTETISTATIAAPLIALEEEGEKTVTTKIFDYLTNPVFITVRVELNEVKWSEINPFEESPEEVKVDNFENLYDDEYHEVSISEILNEVKSENKNNETIEQIIASSNGRWLIEENFINDDSIIKLGITEPPSIHSNYERLFNVLTQYASSGNRIYITTDNEFQSQRLTDLLSDFKKELSDLLETGIVK
ncbi:MAG: hypothetical protein Q8Q47_09225, partial [Ignavibacteriaceae bacterium]|nr:hypothetical protein [Ignavibacteriaceae bacterium]